MAEVTISNGVVEASDSTPAPAAPFTPQPIMPGSRSGGTISISTSSDGSQSFDYTGRGEAPKSGRPAPASSPLTFTRNGRPVLARDVQTSDLVDLGGAIGETSVGAALNCGWLHQGSNGFERAGEAAAAPRYQAPQQGTQDADMPGDLEAQEVQRDLFDGQTETVLEALQSHHGDAYRMIEAALVDGKEPNLDAAAGVMGVGHDDLVGIVEQVRSMFAEQATRAVTEMVGDADAVFQWAVEDRQGKKLFRDARAQHARDRSLEGYARLAQGYLVDLASKDPAAVAAGLVAGGTPASVVRGKVMIDLGNGQGATSLEAAFKSGLADFGKKRRGRK
jgi:hypothetical protein